MSDSELKTIWENNSDIKYDVISILSDNEYYFIQNEIYSYFRCYDRNTGHEKWYIDMHESSQCFYITVKPENYADFLEGCQKYINDYGPTAFSQDDIYMIGRLLEKVDFYIDCLNNYEDISDSRFYDLEKWIETGIERLATALADTVKMYEDSVYDNDYQFSYFSDACYLEDSGLYILDNDYSIVYEDKTISYT